MKKCFGIESKRQQHEQINSKTTSKSSLRFFKRSSSSKKNAPVRGEIKCDIDNITMPDIVIRHQNKSDKQLISRKKIIT